MGRSAANRAFLVGLGGFLLMASGCTRTVSGSGNVTSTPVPVSTFSRLAVSNAFDVTVSFGDQENVTLRVDDTSSVTWTLAFERDPARPGIGIVSEQSLTGPNEVAKLVSVTG